MLSKGQKINDRYEIVKSIGEGGMANVYLAKDTILDRNVAIKVLRGDLSADEKFIRRFEREAQAVSNLSHPNIVEVYDVGPVIAPSLIRAFALSVASTPNTGTTCAPSLFEHKLMSQIARSAVYAQTLSS